ncbi:hypothetical protein L9F63_003160, partial [Diploptera punctata]
FILFLYATCNIIFWSSPLWGLEGLTCPHSEGNNERKYILLFIKIVQATINLFLIMKIILSRQSSNPFKLFFFLKGLFAILLLYIALQQRALVSKLCMIDIRDFMRSHPTATGYHRPSWYLLNVHHGLNLALVKLLKLLCLLNTFAMVSLYVGE